MGGMKRIKIEDLKIGMKFTKSLFDPHMNIVLPAGKVLDKYTLNQLKSKRIEYVETAGEVIMVDESPVSSFLPPQQEKPEKKTIIVNKETAKYIDFYKECVSAISKIYKKIGNGESVETEEVQSLASKIVNTLSTEPNPNNFINLVNLASKGEYLANHVINVTILAVLLGKKLGYSTVKLFNLALASLVYDIGMVKVPTIIIEKEGALSPEEFNIIKTHPIYSYQIISKELGLPVEIARVGLEHHERFDGSGYPRKLIGHEISELSRIIAIVDTYEALIKDRSYREGKDNYEAMRMVLGEGSKKMDTEILKFFLSMMSIYPVGSYVELSNGCIAQVISSDPVSPFFPTVKIVRDEFKEPVTNSEVIRLSKRKDIYIVKSLSLKEMKNAK